VRRPTLIVLIVLFLVIVVTAIVQFTVAPPETPFAGPTSPGQLPTPSASP
jgi:hypothetical protein